jgi:HlyD family secretion protein
VRRPVVIGLRNSRVAELKEGLADGDIVVLYPGEALDDGTRVAPRSRR